MDRQTSHGFDVLMPSGAWGMALYTNKAPQTLNDRVADQFRLIPHPSQRLLPISFLSPLKTFNRKPMVFWEETKE